uniref:flavin reductase n=1 Tax=Aminobacter niigataensis TaxID=83265 RepID=UPI002852C0D6|nr:flavin reductase [Aminobacter niigataensis]WMD00090.1 flavin reductase [Aminobacter niigataensis]
MADGRDVTDVVDVVESKGEAACQGMVKFDPLQLRRVFGKFATGVTVVTTESNGRSVGITCNSFSSVSLEPPLLLWSLRKANLSYDDFVNAKHFAVNILASDQIDISSKFAKSGADKFAGIKFDRGLGNVPLLRDTTATFECKVDVIHEAGDHVVIIGRVMAFASSDRAPLIFSDGRYVDAIERPPLRTSDGDQSAAVPEDPLHQFVSVLLLRAFHSVIELLSEARSEIGVTINESRLLTVADAYPGSGLDELLPRTYLASSAIVDALRTLRQRGYLVVDPAGKIVVTDLGQQKVRAYNTRFKDLENYLFRSLAPDQIEAFRKVLLSIMKSAPSRPGTSH